MECNPTLELNHSKHKRKVNYTEDKEVTQIGLWEMQSSQIIFLNQIEITFDKIIWNFPLGPFLTSAYTTLITVFLAAMIAFF